MIAEFDPGIEEDINTLKQEAKMYKVSLSEYLLYRNFTELKNLRIWSNNIFNAIIDPIPFITDYSIHGRDARVIYSKEK